MSVLIKGMEMPKPKLADMATIYGAYVLVCPNGYSTIVVENEDGLDTTYHLVAVQSHGDLIDRSQLCDDSIGGDYGSGTRVYYAYEVEHAPVIIPSDRAEEGKA